MSAEDVAHLEAWLTRAPENEAAMARCQAAALLAPRLRERAAVRWAFREATELATHRAQPTRRELLPWYRRPRLAWSVAALALAAAAAATLDSYRGPDGSTQPEPSAALPRALVADDVQQPDLRHLLAIDTPIHDRAVFLYPAYARFIHRRRKHLGPRDSNQSARPRIDKRAGASAHPSADNASIGFPGCPRL